jgi:hypothetical protein
MAYDRTERMDAEQKEVQSNNTANGAVKTFGEEAADTEFAADTWTGAVFTPQEKRSRETITYDPHTQTERYRGEDSLDGGALIPPLRGKNVTRYETAAEIAPDYRTREEGRSPVSEPERENNKGGGVGMTALGLSILSLFLLPYLLAPIGLVLGYLAFRRGARTMGVWAMVIGVAAILGAIVIYPFFIAR